MEKKHEILEYFWDAISLDTLKELVEVRKVKTRRRTAQENGTILSFFQSALQPNIYYVANVYYSTPAVLVCIQWDTKTNTFSSVQQLNIAGAGNSHHMYLGDDLVHYIPINSFKLPEVELEQLNTQIILFRSTNTSAYIQAVFDSKDDMRDDFLTKIKIGLSEGNTLHARTIKFKKEAIREGATYIFVGGKKTKGDSIPLCLVYDELTQEVVKFYNECALMRKDENTGELQPLTQGDAVYFLDYFLQGEKYTSAIASKYSAHYKIYGELGNEYVTDNQLLTHSAE